MGKEKRHGVNEQGIEGNGINKRKSEEGSERRSKEGRKRRLSRDEG